MKTELSEAQLLAQIDLDRLPQHIAVIMDGNGRWAKKRRLPRIASKPSPKPSGKPRRNKSNFSKTNDARERQLGPRA